MLAIPETPVQTNTFTQFQEYIYISRYSRFLHEVGRREKWNETVKRYFDFFQVHLKEQHDFLIAGELRQELEAALLNLEVMPSMRCLVTAGPALQKENVAGYNCAYLPIDNPKSFAEVLYILMNGTGVGFSVEREYVHKLPEIPEAMYPTDTTIVVADSKLGWAKSLNELISLLYTGLIPKWDLSRLRPAGSILKTFGGRSSGPKPLDRLFRFVVETFEQYKNSQLTSAACHHIVCMIGECVVVGGVRRSATISLSDLFDTQMRSIKSGQWYTLYPWLSNANNSAVYLEKQPPMQTFMDEWKSLYDSKSGERGIFSRYAARKNIIRSNELRKEWFGDKVRQRDPDQEFGCNPCSEVNLLPDEFCNLSEVVIRATDTFDELKRKTRIAAIFGTFQSTLTNFRFLNKRWANNTEGERLLGVSLTGIMDNKLTSGQLGEEKLKQCLLELRKVVIATNMEFAKKIGIPASVASTSVKPSGTVSALNDTASGIHARHSPYYIRTVRSDKKDPLTQLMIDQGFYHEDDQMRPAHNTVFYFPMKSPKGAICRNDVSALEHLNIWLTYQNYWTEHKPSITVSVKEDEWLEVGNWVYKNFENVSGISFLPFSDHSYQQAPFQDITEEQYKEWVAKTPKKVDWNKLSEYENTDLTTGSQELSCSGVSITGEVGCNIIKGNFAINTFEENGLWLDCIYIWKDKKYQRFYIGSHWGLENDGYVCSSNNMRHNYRNRPQDFKRRIITRVTNRLDLLAEEQRWLDMIKPEEFGRRYYNISSKVNKRCWWMNEETKRQVLEKINTPERNKKISESQKGKILSKEHRQKIKDSWYESRSEDFYRKIKVTRAKQIITSETKEKISKALTGVLKGRKFPGRKNSGQFQKGHIPWNQI